MSARRTTKTGYMAYVSPIAPADGEGFLTVVHRRTADNELVIRSPRGSWFTVEAVRAAGFVVTMRPSAGPVDERRAAEAMTDGTLAALNRLTALSGPDQAGADQERGRR